MAYRSTITTPSAASRKVKAALYIRVSTLYQIDKDSLPFQRQELINLAKYMLGTDDYEVFEDAGYSGKNTDRPSYQRMMTRIRQREFTHLCVWKIDRISRNLLDFAAMYDELKKYNVTFVSKNEQFDTSSAMGEAMLKIILVFAELERKLTSERVMGVMLDRASKGLWNGARMPLGYKWDTNAKFPVIDADEAVTIRFIFDKYEEVKSTLQISRILNRNHIKTKRGGEWTSKTVNDIVRNPFYKGTYRYNYRESARGAIKNEEEWIIVPNALPAIITEEQWTRCNALMDSHRETKDTSSFRVCHTHIFAGILKCCDCGGGFSSNRDRPRLSGWRPSTYRCTRSAKMQDCPTFGISDVVLGPFIFNYIANFVRLQRKGTNYTVESIEKALLSGKPFENIAGIDSTSLEETLLALKQYNSSSNAANYSPDLLEELPNQSDNGSNIDIELLRQEENKYKTALQRLLDLYLFDPTAMPQKDYLLRKEELEGKLQEVQASIKRNSASTPEAAGATDISFIKKASVFIISQRILSKQDIDFEDLIQKCTPELLKDLVNSTIKEIGIRGRRVEYIEFQSGLRHTFIYRD